MPDTDNDGLLDEYELLIGTDPQHRDTDNDGLSDTAERLMGTKPTEVDSDGDGLGDGSEVAQRQDPLHADRSAPPERPRQPTADDRDADGLDDRMEHLIGTRTDDPDSDGDGIGDFVEWTRGTDPTNRLSNGPGDTTTDLDDVRSELRQLRQTRAVTDPGTTVVEDPPITGSVGLLRFVDVALAQIGDRYQFGVETNLNDANPDAFDSSELVQWAAAQAGVKLPDGSWNQYRHLYQSGNTLSVEDALRMPGALVFGFSSDPLASSSRPQRAFVGISTGNGTVIDVSERAGEVREMDPGNFYTHAAVIPELVDDLDSDQDGVADQEERRRGTDPFDLGTASTAAAPSTTPGADDNEAIVEDGEHVASAEAPAEAARTSSSSLLIDASSSEPAPVAVAEVAGQAEEPAPADVSVPSTESLPVEAPPPAETWPSEAGGSYAEADSSPDPGWTFEEPSDDVETASDYEEYGVA